MYVYIYTQQHQTTITTKQINTNTIHTQTPGHPPLQDLHGGRRRLHDHASLPLQHPVRVLFWCMYICVCTDPTYTNTHIRTNIHTHTYFLKTHLKLQVRLVPPPRRLLSGLNGRGRHLVHALRLLQEGMLDYVCMFVCVCMYVF